MERDAFLDEVIVEEIFEEVMMCGGGGEEVGEGERENEGVL